MSVFTHVSEEQARVWLKNYAIGSLESLVGITQGVQNSNFFLTTSLGHYVLTLFEDTPRADLPFYLHLMAHLARHGLPVPAPIADLNNEYSTTLSERPAVLVMRLLGKSVEAPSVKHCRRVGVMLAGLHLAGRTYGRKHSNPRNAQWRAQTAQTVLPFLSAQERALLEAELAFEATMNFDSLPSGVIHADLFRDNVLWNEDRISGVIDFYFAGNDAWLFDIAVAVNDWCLQADGAALDAPRVQALLEGYAAERAFTQAERLAWHGMLRAGALRFWLSRLADKHLPRQSDQREMVMVKNPDEYRDILRARVQAVSVEALSLPI